MKPEAGAAAHAKPAVCVESAVKRNPFVPTATRVTTLSAVPTIRSPFASTRVWSTALAIVNGEKVKISTTSDATRAVRAVIDVPEDAEIYVYGTMVKDFHTVDKNYIFTLNVCATQELHRRIEAQDKRIKDLEEKVERLLAIIINN